MKFLITAFGLLSMTILHAGVLEDLSKASKANPEIVMDVVQTKNVSFFNETFKSVMSISVSSSGKMRMQTLEPFKALSIFDGKNFVRFENTDGKWKKLEGASGIVAKRIFDEMRNLLSGSVSSSAYEVSEKGNDCVLLIPKSEFVRKVVKSIEISTRIDNGVRLIEKISILDCDGDITTLEIKKISKASFSPKTFDIDLPL